MEMNYTGIFKKNAQCGGKSELKLIFSFLLVSEFVLNMLKYLRSPRTVQLGDLIEFSK